MFRPEAVEHSLARSHGTVLLARSLSHAVLTWLFAAIAAVVVLFFVFAGVTRKADVAGVLLPAQGLIRVLCTQAGVVLESHVREGQPVKAGDVLFVLGSERASARHGDVEQAIASLLQSRRDSLSNEQQQLRQQTRQRTDAARQHADDLAAEIRRIAAQRLLQQRRVGLAEAALQRFADLQASGFVSAVQVHDKQADLLDQQQRLADLDRAQAATQRELDAARAALRELPLQAARELQAGQRGIATLEQDLAENEARRRVVVRAPQDGTVTAITAEPGQPATLHQALVSLLPAGSELEAELYAPSRAAGFVKPGMQVLLRYQAYPYQKFGQALGRVREVSASAMRPDELALAPTNASEPLYRVRVALDRQTVAAYGAAHPLVSGAALDATVLLERRRLIEWVLEPLYTISGRS
ncbi:HlyD family secretion protein [Piscinibacter sp.]|uniref:HlyD family secretion protein n=1 Tax=Piscinibacter sp. TaxID=1903157 RepID=UPI002CEE9405|nr:HlyD family efflux transporter periplasmic adaptor subunit [Albitalea sp.]HUG26585.1 HlyD family efflux transporter periplasmic adaptor subunit [Albitalea sp.]